MLHFLSSDGLLDHGIKVRAMTLPDVFVNHDSPSKQYEAAALTAPNIVSTALSALRLDEVVETPARA